MQQSSIAIGFGDTVPMSSAVYAMIDEVCSGGLSQIGRLQGLLHRAIDRLRTARSAPESIRLAEQMSVAVHQLAVMAKQGSIGSERMLVERRLEKLGREWLLTSPLLH